MQTKGARRQAVKASEDDPAVADRTSQPACDFPES
jgi:hypothetical protein